MLKNSQLLKFD